MDAESLIKILRAYDASFDASAVKSALADPQSTELVRWAAVHLTPDTLLTADELNQYAALEESGLAERLAVSSDLSVARAPSDQEFRSAIAELNRSTQAITRHTETLRQQQEALDRLVTGSHSSAQDRTALEAARARKWNAQRADLKSDVVGLSESLTSRTLELEEQRTGASSELRQTVDTMFRSDDKLLSSLQKLGWELETGGGGAQEDVALLRETCARLIKYTVEGLRTRLDRIYLETLEHSAQSSAATRVSSDEVSAMQEELESLYAEILPVAQMTAEQQFLEPALKSLAAVNGRGQAMSGQATSYIHECLDHLIDRAQELLARVDAFQAYQLAAAAVLDMAKAELNSVAVEASPARQIPIDSRDALSPIRPRPKQPSRHSLGASGIGTEPPLEEILRKLAINLPLDEEASVDVDVQIRELTSTLATRRAKVQDVAKNVQETFEGAAVKHASDGKLAIQLVRDSILAESPFGDVRLVDPEIEGSIAVLSQELANVDEKLKGIDADVAGLRVRNAKRDELVSRWGS